MARNVGDLALLLSVMAGPDPRAPHGARRPRHRRSRRRSPARSPGCGSRSSADLGGAFEVDAEVAAVVEAAGRGLRRRRRHGRRRRTPTSPRPTTPSAPCGPGTSRRRSATLLAEHPDDFKQSLADNIRAGRAPHRRRRRPRLRPAHRPRPRRMRRVLRRRTTCWCCRSRRCRRSRPTRSTRPRSTAGRWRPTSTGCGRRT